MNFYTKELIMIYLKPNSSFVCDRCDDLYDDDVNFKISNPSNEFESTRKYCKNCIHKSQVIDWETEE